MRFLLIPLVFLAACVSPKQAVTASANVDPAPEMKAPRKASFSPALDSNQSLNPPYYASSDGWGGMYLAKRDYSDPRRMTPVPKIPQKSTAPVATLASGSLP
jgi:hypothetical protein